MWSTELCDPAVSVRVLSAPCFARKSHHDFLMSIYPKFYRRLRLERISQSVIHEVGGHGSGSDSSRGLYALADTWDGRHAGPTSFFNEALRDQAEIEKRQLKMPTSG
jgi:hypothetical protein